MIDTTKKQLGFTTLSHLLARATGMNMGAKETLNLGYATQEVVRFNEETWIVYDRSKRLTANINETQLTELICGSLVLTNLNWR